jgi:HAE1 family hydrophobic/amphiphilic exporter-1
MASNDPHQSSDFHYLEQLKFDPALRKSWLNFFVTHFRVVVLMILLLSAWGIYSYQKLPRESNPEVKIPVALVMTAYPGASPADVEELVTKKLETEIATLKGVKKITSSSANSVSSVSVEFEAGEDLEDSVRSLRDKVTEAKSELPDEAEEPRVNEVSFDDQPIVTFALSGPYDGLTLRKHAEDLRDELEKIPGVREVRVSGGDERELSVAYDPGKLALFGISADQANRRIAATNLALPGGTVEGTAFNYPVRTDARVFTAETLGRIPVLHKDDGMIVYLDDIARVEEKAVKRTVTSRLSTDGSEPQEAVTLEIVKKTGGSVLDTVDTAKATADRMVASFPSGMKYDVTTDFAKQIRKDFDQLKHDFVLTVILVMGTLFLFVGLKESLIAGLAIPLVFFVTFGVMQMTGITLNFLSLFSLLLALGLLVDDAIVVVSATKQYLRTGKFTPEEAVLLVLNDFKVVLTTTTFATVWAFLPLLLASGIMGEFLKSIPITVSVVLVASLLVALMINHPLAAVLERIRFTKKSFFLAVICIFGIGTFAFAQGNAFGFGTGALAVAALLSPLHWYFAKQGRLALEKNKALMEQEWIDDELIKEKLRTQGRGEDKSFASRLVHGIVHLDHVIPLYERMLRAAIATRKRRLTVLLSTLALFIGAVLLPVFGIVPMEFFPPSDEETIFINVTAPTGMKLEETDRITRQVEEKLLRHPEIVNFSTVVGREGISPNRAQGESAGTPSNLAGITVTLSEPKERDITSFDMATLLRKEMSDIREATVSVESLAGGPPAGAAFEARIVGDDLQTLDKIVQDTKPLLASIPGVIDITSSLKEAPADYTFTLDPARLELYGLDAASVGSTLRMAISGLEVSNVFRDNKEIKIVASFDEAKMPTLESVQNLQILNGKGRPVYIKDVATVELKPSVSSITRIDQKRAVLLAAGVEPGAARPAEVLSAFQEKLKNEYRLPEGYEIVYGGENEQNQESVMSILRALIVAAVLIVATIVIQFNSFRQAAIVLITLPLALIGVFVGMAVFQVTLSFPGLIGILALFGIVVKNAIILIDKINLNLRSGIPFDESVVDAGKSRLEAIFITSLCTILGILPVTLSNALWKALGSAVIFGLALSSFLTLFIVPVLFHTFARRPKTEERQA